MADVAKSSSDFGVSRRALLKILSGAGLAAALGQGLGIGRTDAAVTGGLRESSLTHQVSAFQPLETVFDGLGHSPLGSAQLSISNSNLLVSNLGSSGQDGVSITLGEVGGFHIEGELPSSLPIGAVMESETFGRVNGVQNQPAGSLVIEKTGSGVQETPDFRSIGAETYELLLFHNGSLVFNQGGMNGVAATFPTGSLKRCCHVPPTGTDFAYSNVSLTAQPVEVNGGPIVLADFTIYRAENPEKKVDYISSASIKVKEIPQISIEDEWIILSGVPHHSLGQARFDAAGGTLTISNIGSSGQDGVLFDFLDFIVGFVDIRGFRVDWLDLDPTGVLPVGATLMVSATGVVDGLLGQNLGLVHVENTSPVLEFVPDFSPVQSSTHQVEVYNEGVLVKAVRGHTGQAATVGSGASPKPWPTGVAILRGEVSNYAFMWPTPLVITIPGEGTFTGDELRILAETGGVNSLQGVSLQAVEISTITLTDETMTKGFDVYLPLVQKSQ